MTIESSNNQTPAPTSTVPVGGETSVGSSITNITSRPTTRTEYDISLVQGDTFTLDFHARTVGGLSFDLAGYTASMQLKRSSHSDVLLAELTTNYPQGSYGKGTTGDFSSGSGVTGLTGGIQLNYSGVTGTIRIQIDSDTSASIPRGKHPYDIQVLSNTTGINDTILFGRIDVSGNVTRI